MLSPWIITVNVVIIAVYFPFVDMFLLYLVVEIMIYLNAKKLHGKRNLNMLIFGLKSIQTAVPVRQ